MQNSTIYRTDVIDVADRLGISLCEADIDEVLASYPTAQDEDPTATWDLVIEQCIYNII